MKSPLPCFLRIALGICFACLVAGEMIPVAADPPTADKARYETRFDQGLQCLQQGRTAEALQAFEDASAADPTSPHPYMNRGQVYQSQGQLDQALAMFKRARELDSRDATYPFKCGIISKKLGKRDEAIAFFEQALQINPRLFQAHFHLGNLQREAGHLDQAAAAYQKAIDIGDMADAHLNLGMIRFDQGNASATVFHQLALERLKSPLVPVLKDYIASHPASTRESGPGSRFP